MRELSSYRFPTYCLHNFPSGQDKGLSICFRILGINAKDVHDGERSGLLYHSPTLEWSEGRPLVRPVGRSEWVFGREEYVRGVRVYEGRG